MTAHDKPLIRLHGFRTWDRSGKARWTLTELGLPFENRWLNSEKKEHETPEYLKLNPMGRVPVLEIDGHLFFESNAICLYLADRFGQKKLAPSPDSPDRPRYLQWMFFSEATIAPIQAKIQIVEDIPPGELFQKKESALTSDFNDVLETLDQGLRGDFLLGDRLSTADLCVSYQLFFAMLWPELATHADRHPRVLAYLERMKKLPSADKCKIFSYPD